MWKSQALKQLIIFRCALPTSGGNFSVWINFLMAVSSNLMVHDMMNTFSFILLFFCDTFPWNYRKCMLSLYKIAFPVLVRFLNGYVLKWLYPQMMLNIQVKKKNLTREVYLLLHNSVCPNIIQSVCLIFRWLYLQSGQHLGYICIRCCCTLGSVDSSSVNKKWLANFLFETHFLATF